jgi:hypothetical protein
MMSALARNLQIIAAMKTETPEAATRASIPIFDSRQSRIGSMVPVGPWIASDRAKVQDICDWRQDNMTMYLSHFTSTYERTKTYLDQVCATPDRILFLIMDETERLVGHLGIAKVSDVSVELDNLVRGRAGGAPRLILLAQKTLLEWCFSVLDVTLATAGVISYNTKALAFHKMFGLSIDRHLPLEKTETPDFTSHKILESGPGNVDYDYVILKIDRDDFQEKYSASHPS